MRKENDLDQFLVNSSEYRSVNENTSQSLVRCLVGGVASASIFCLIILFILLIIPITVLVVGINYHDPRYCPIEPRISLFLIVSGSVSLGWIVLTIVVTILTIMAASRRPFNSVGLVIVLSVIILIITIFSIIWLIIGSVWTFSVYMWVTYNYDTMNNFYPYNYCQPELYRFTFVYLILSFILVVFQCSYYCFNSIFRSLKQ
jgi:hypothetical protein